MPNFIKDSGNNYTLYVDQGADYSLTINANTFGVTDLTNLTFRGSVKQHQTSKRSEDFTITKNQPANSITIVLSRNSTINFKQQRYKFDVFYTVNNLATRAFGGDVIVKNNITSE